MLSREKYVTLSLELHLFFARIMKEHALFLEAGFTPKNEQYGKTADVFKVNFETLLLNVVRVAMELSGQMYYHPAKLLLIIR